MKKKAQKQNDEPHLSTEIRFMNARDFIAERLSFSVSVQKENGEREKSGDIHDVPRVSSPPNFQPEPRGCWDHEFMWYFVWQKNVYAFLFQFIDIFLRES